MSDTSEMVINADVARDKALAECQEAIEKALAPLGISVNGRLGIVPCYPPRPHLLKNYRGAFPKYRIVGLHLGLRSFVSAVDQAGDRSHEL